MHTHEYILYLVAQERETTQRTLVEQSGHRRNNPTTWSLLGQRQMKKELYNHYHYYYYYYYYYNIYIYIYNNIITYMTIIQCFPFHCFVGLVMRLPLNGTQHFGLPPPPEKIQGETLQYIVLHRINIIHIKVNSCRKTFTILL